MGVPACQYHDARCRAQPCGADDPSAAQARLRPRRISWRYGSLICALWAGSAQAESIRIATFAAPLSRDGPGLLLRDLQRAEDAQVDAIVRIVELIAPDVLLLTDFDYDLDGHALDAFAERLSQDYPFRFAAAPNAGVPTMLDVDGNGWRGDARDAQGYGRFYGDGGMAILSRFEIITDDARDLSHLLWRDLEGAVLPTTDGEPFLDATVQDVLRLSSTGHWIVPLRLPDDDRLSLLAFAATPPVFDGPEDMNGLRNRDELRLWESLLTSEPPDGFVVIGNANLDPTSGQGDRSAMAAFLARPDLNDPHIGQPNADWGADGPGQLRVSYVLPATSWQIIDAGTLWPAMDDPDRHLIGADGQAAGPHRIVWVDLFR